MQCFCCLDRALHMACPYLEVMDTLGTDEVCQSIGILAGEEAEQKVEEREGIEVCHDLKLLKPCTSLCSQVVT